MATDSIDEEPDLDPNMERAVFGAEVERFLAEDRIGRFIVEKAAAEVQDALLELKDVEPNDPTRIRAIQSRIRVAESVVGWLAGAVDDGLRARQILENEV